jgi:hypothetical protein
VKWIRTPAGIGTLIVLVAAVISLIVFSQDDEGSGGTTTRTVERPGGSTSTQPSDPIAQTIREYVAAINAENGERVCALLVPGAEKELKAPKPRGGCAPTLSASIGYADPRGSPVWKRSEIRSGLKVTESDDRARVTVAMVHRFADRKFVSVEDDVIYLRRQGDRWLIVKPSATLYRAIGVPEVPLSALKPPARWSL